MSVELIIFLVAAIVFGLVIAAIIMKLERRKKPLDKQYFTMKWQSAQKLCSTKETWPLAVIDADKLLDEALRKSHCKGKSMGERLSYAQKQLSDKDSVWYGHKLRNRLVHESDVTLTEKDVRKALMGIRQALRDLGAL